MKRNEALALMREGKKITHRHFTTDEWIKTSENGLIYILEDGVECDYYEFWRWRTDETWEDGYELYKE